MTILLSADGLIAPPAAGALSPHEREVIGRATQGMSNYQIARCLDIAESIVKRHMHSVFCELGARCRVEAANRAVELGLIDPSVPMPSRHAPTTARGPHRP
ncbi:LuxR C-terminal-related transcriptional regulator [Streptomyces sp. SL13]|uniref:LuxR C-terminal-related transcriptional regulator n=1 Tax=Streptantibioticus silvisoli TaxID=2705255 RepID=A0AA90K8I1_9ACTN|nr:LuxR C-terminal-related transcriptional regulator [Streptantibioticus silvisoli]MDI5963959.1 LuxR C-terminal-related transcriptional regulator [Streptantibioticus silvisoli]MDI5970078.1 LuxR C-terminal-related transcriptional regulator [Streptantibioticus silvisoli]